MFTPTEYNLLHRLICLQSLLWGEITTLNLTTITFGASFIHLLPHNHTRPTLTGLQRKTRCARVAVERRRPASTTLALQSAPPHPTPPSDTRPACTEVSLRASPPQVRFTSPRRRCSVRRRVPGCGSGNACSRCLLRVRHAPRHLASHNFTAGGSVCLAAW